MVRVNILLVGHAAHAYCVLYHESRVVFIYFSTLHSMFTLHSYLFLTLLLGIHTFTLAHWFDWICTWIERIIRMPQRARPTSPQAPGRKKPLFPGRRNQKTNFASRTLVFIKMVACWNHVTSNCNPIGWRGHSLLEPLSVFTMAWSLSRCHGCRSIIMVVTSAILTLPTTC